MVSLYKGFCKFASSKPDLCIYQRADDDKIEALVVLDDDIISVTTSKNSKDSYYIWIVSELQVKNCKMLLNYSWTFKKEHRLHIIQMILF